jgi:hypothetical protein
MSFATRSAARYAPDARITREAQQTKSSAGSEMVKPAHAPCVNVIPKRSSSSTRGSTRPMTSSSRRPSPSPRSRRRSRSRRSHSLQRRSGSRQICSRGRRRHSLDNRRRRLEHPHSLCSLRSLRSHVRSRSRGKLQAACLAWNFRCRRRTERR